MSEGRGVLRRLFGIFLIVTCTAFYVIMFILEAKLRSVSGFGTIGLQAAFSPESAGSIIGGWFVSGLEDKARLSFYLDFGFLASYTASMILLAVGKGMPILFVVIPLIGAFDIAENILHLNMINTMEYSSAPFAFSITLLKYVCFMLSFILLFVAIMRKRKKTEQ